jgi:hypothetical protein
MTPKELAFLVAGVIGAVVYKRLGVPPPEHYDDGNLPGCLFSLGMLLALLTGLPTPGVLAWCAIRALITVLGLAPLAQP